jgi:hypothetical protein
MVSNVSPPNLPPPRRRLRGPYRPSDRAMMSFWISDVPE